MSAQFKSLTVLSLILVMCAQASTQKKSYNLVDELPNIYIDSITEKIGHTWENGKVWDKPLIKKFYSLLPRERYFVVMDLGAQTGSFSLLAHYFPNSRWYSFEPIEEAANALKANLALNDIHNVTVYQCAVSNFNGKTILKLPSMNAWGLATLGSNPQRFVTQSERVVDVINLDSFVLVHNIPKIDFMKLDTEGSELNILRGARGIIERDHPIMLMEYNETNMKQCGVHKHEVDEFLTEMGYTWTLISSEDILCIPISSCKD